MNARTLAAGAVARADRWLQSAERALEDRRWDDAVYAAQMGTEHAAKGVLIALGIEYPKQHDVSPVFVRLGDRSDLLAAFREDVEGASAILGELAAERALAAYGFEAGIDADHFRDYAPGAVEKARSVRALCGRLLRALARPEG